MALLVRDFDADRRAPGDRGEDAHIGRCHRVGDVFVEARHAGDLDAGSELELVAGDGRADGHADEACLDTVRGQCRFEHPAGFLDETLVDLLCGAASEKAQRRKLPAALLRSGTERDLELLDDRLRFLVVNLVVELGVVVDRDVQLCGVVLVDHLTGVARVLLFDVVDERGAR